MDLPTGSIACVIADCSTFIQPHFSELEKNVGPTQACWDACRADQSCSFLASQHQSAWLYHKGCSANLATFPQTQFRRNGSKPSNFEAQVMFGNLPTKGWQTWMAWSLIAIISLIGLCLLGIMLF
jgi:hypothetical protein